MHNDHVSNRRIEDEIGHERWCTSEVVESLVGRYETNNSVGCLNADIIRGNARSNDIKFNEGTKH